MNCDRIAGWYRWLEYAGFGRELERRRLRFLPEVADARRILVLGDGDGRFLEHLVRQNAGAEIDYVDLSRRMLEIAQSRAGNGRVTYRQGDALTLPLPSNEYDLVVTHFFLDCFDEIEQKILANRLREASRPGARWLISEFRQPGQGWRAIWARLWIGMLYLFFGWTTGLQTRKLVDHHPILERAGFRLELKETARWGMLASEVWIRGPL